MHMHNKERKVNSNNKIITKFKQYTTLRLSQAMSRHRLKAIRVSYFDLTNLQSPLKSKLVSETATWPA